MRWKIKLLLIFGLSISLLLSSSCKRNQIQEPSPVGPSTLSVILKLTTSTNVLFAGLESRPVTTITAHLSKYDGIPIPNRTIHFEIRDASGFPATIGFFDGNQSSKTVVTNSNGEASCQYYGPTASELPTYSESPNDIEIYIQAIVAGEGKEYIWERTPLYIIRDVIELDLQAYAVPNVLWVTSTPPKAKINALVTLANGAPLVGARVFYKIRPLDEEGNEGRGEFENGTRNIRTITNSEGKASVTYFGPYLPHFPANQDEAWVTIRVILQTSGVNEDIYVDVKIRLVKGNY